ncbi:Uncharacterized protein PKNOH_S060437103 [Plasmodium knowlesi]|uniref:Uncharacterized protein n=1 Tax=Plasmodium knowlesi TaxID=5850 RepID=A0A1Y3DT23_PLAKN|nr:Uncharacterized protein PKNOH_S060437103 [Plasmodium knowlesi]
MQVKREIGQNPGRRGNKRAHAPKTDIAQGRNVCNKKSRKNSHNENSHTEGCGDNNPGSRRTYNPNDLHAYNHYDEQGGYRILNDEAHDASCAPKELENSCDGENKIVHAESKNYRGVAPDGNEDITMSTYDDNTMEEGGNTQQCDMHDAWITLCQYFNCMQKRDYVNEEDTHSELTVSPNHFVATPNSFCHRNNFFCSEHKEDYSTVNSLDSKKAGGIFCWSASHQRDYSYYFSLDKNNSVSSDTMTHSLDNNTSHTVEENLNMKRKSSAVHFGEHSAANSDEGLPCGLSAMGMSLDGDMSSEQNGEVSGAKIADEKSAQSVDEINAQGDDEINAQGDDEINAQGDDEINAQGDDEINAQGDDEINAQIADDEINAQGDDEKIAQIADDEKSAQRGEIKIGEEPSDEQPGQHWGRGEEAENANERPGDDNPNVRNQDDEEEERKRESQVIVDKVYHHQCNGSSHLSNNRASVTKENSKKEETDLNTKGSNRHMVKIIQKYSRRFKNFRKIKQNKEGWIKENDKYLDLWHRVDSDNNISVHIRGKLPYDVSMILSIISETELSTHWVPFLTSSEKIKSLSKSSALIAQLYEYPIIGKKESLMYGLGANTLEELGCIILCCMCPPELKKDIEFYQNMCEQMNINKNEEILKVKETPLKFRKVKREVTFFDCQLPDPTPKIDRQRAANLCFLIYPLNNGKSTVLELFVHFENEFKYTPIKMVTYFIKKIVKNMYANIIKTCKNYHTIYADRLNTNQEFYLWLNDQIKKYTKSKHQTKFIDSISLESYHEPENNDAL